MTPGNIASFSVFFDASNAGQNDRFSTLITVYSNAVDLPDFLFSLQIREVEDDTPFRIEWIPFPKNEAEPLDLGSRTFDIKDVMLPAEQLEGKTVRRISFRIRNISRDNILVNQFKTSFNQGGEKVKWGGLLLQKLILRNRDYKKGTIRLKTELPAGWSAQFSDANPEIGPNQSKEVILTLTPPTAGNQPDPSSRVIATFDRIPDLKDTVPLNLDLQLAAPGAHAVIDPDKREIDLGYIKTGGLITRTLEVSSRSRYVDAGIALVAGTDHAFQLGEVNALDIAPGETVTFKLMLDTSHTGNQEAMILFSQPGIGQLAYTVKANVVKGNAPPSKVPGFVASVQGKNINGRVVEDLQPRIDFRWEHPFSLVGLGRYELHLRQEGKEKPAHEIKLNHPKRVYSLAPKLELGKTYSYHIRARDKKGQWGPFVKGGTFTVKALS